MLTTNVNYGGKTPNQTSVIKSVNVTVDKYKSNGTLPTFTKTIKPSSIGGLYVKTFNNYY
jgi:hypothetical protein